MNKLIASSAPTETMSSRELAEMYCKPHYDTLKKIRKLESAYIEVFGDEGKFSFISYTDSQNREKPEILLNKSQTLFVASRFDAVLHAKVQKRWEELENKERRTVDPMTCLNDPAAMRGLLLAYTEKVLMLEEEKKILTPKAEALDRIAYADGTNCITDTAKVLQVRPKDLFSLLSSERWIYRRPGGKGWIAYQEKIQQGLLTHKVTTIMDIHTGKERVIEQVLVTPKGLAKLASKVEGVAA
jgi:phage antirepressor YoqD-like protein